MIRRILKKVLTPILQPLTKAYLSKDRTYQLHGIKIKVRKGVFHPGLFFSTRILFDYIKEQDLSQETFLELGAGTGLISVVASQMGAEVTASDISEMAIQNMAINADSNQVEFSITKSDLFENIPKQIFDWVVINPPYYPRDPRNEEEKAWFCGKDFQFFQGLFKNLGEFINQNSRVILILSQDCEQETILKIASHHGFRFQKILEKRTWWEKNYIFQVLHQSNSQAE